MYKDPVARRRTRKPQGPRDSQFDLNEEAVMRRVLSYGPREISEGLAIRELKREEKAFEEILVLKMFSDFSQRFKRQKYRSILDVEQLGRRRDRVQLRAGDGSGGF